MKRFLLRASVALVFQIVLLGLALAAPRKVLVLPLDGNAEPALRGRINSTLQRLARRLPGEVSIGDATYGETAAAVGCDPAAPTCADAILTTLGVDELIFGTVSPSGTQTTVVIRRVKAGSPAQTSRATLVGDEPPDQVDGAIGALIGITVTPATTTGTPTTGTGTPTTGTTTGAGTTTTTGPRTGTATTPRVTTTRPRGTDTGTATTTGTPTTTGTDTATTTGTTTIPPPLTPPPPAHDNRKRTTGILIASAGGLTTVIGLMLWSSAAGVQNDIDGAPTRTAGDFAALEDLEGRGKSYALIGDLMVPIGLAVAGYGGWLLYQDHQERRAVTITPQVSPTTAGVVLGGVW